MDHKGLMQGGRAGFPARGAILLAQPRGFCAGVDRAIETVELMLKTDRAGRSGESAFRATGTTSRSGGSLPDNTRDQVLTWQPDCPDHGQPGINHLPPVYVRRQIVHNRHVVQTLKERGVIFVDELGQIPDQAAVNRIPVVFSAHGVAPSVRQEAEDRGLFLVDATCPLVAKVHREVGRFVRRGYEVIYIGHPGHDEAVGVIGEAPDHVHLVSCRKDIDGLRYDRFQKLILLTQTTLSLDETAGLTRQLRERFPWLEEPSTADICFATQNRQHAVKSVAKRVDSMLIVGSMNSSNSVRLHEVAQEVMGGRARAHLIDDAGELDTAWFADADTVGVSSGASAPDDLVVELVEQLQHLGFGPVKSLGTIEENTFFAPPPQARSYQRD